jgi:CRISPR-associated protein Cmr1
VTPAFVGTSDAGQAEWSAKGIRGELRWWFRAVAGGELRGDAAKVRALERSVFGGMDTDAGMDASSTLRVMVRPVRSEPPGAKVTPPFAMDVKNDSDAVRKRLRLSIGRTNPLGYLGYGPIEHSKEAGGFVYKRGRIVENSDLSMTLQWNREVSGEAKSIFGRALWCWINLGGIGARSRRGYGSLVRTDAAGVVAGPKELQAGVIENLGRARAFSPGSQAEWTHFTSQAHIYRSSRALKNWSDAMKYAGGWMVAFRRRYGKDSDERAGIRGRDYEWYKTPVQAGPPNGVPDRAGFGLPLPFRDKVAGWGSNEGRRASPLLVHIARFEPSDYYVIYTHIPARLVPEGKEIGFMGASSPPTVEQKSIVQSFLHDLKAKKLIEEVA